MQLILIIGLSVFLAAELVVSGIWFPGFFNAGSRKETPVIEGNNNSPGTSWTPPALSSIDLTYSAEERASAPSVELKISGEDPKASSGDFSVDFGNYNFIEDDTLTVKTLPVHTDENAGYTLQGYDLSLASGRDSFFGEVAIKIPREESDGDVVLFLTKDPETGENTEEFYEISEDGKSYILYTTHFSDHLKANFCNFNGDQFVEDVKKANLGNEATRKALSSFYYTSYQPYHRWMSAEVAFSPNELWSKLTENSSYLPSSYSLMAAVAEKANAAPPGELPKEVDLGGILVFEEDELKNLIGEQAAAAGFVNDTKTAVIDPGTKALNKLSLENIAPGLKEPVREHAEVLAQNKGSSAFDVLSILTTAVGFAETNRKAIRELEAGKYSSTEQALWANWEGYTGTLISLTGMIGSAVEYMASSGMVAGTAAGTAAAVGSGVAIGAALAGMGLYLYCMSQETPPYADLFGAEMNYRDYYINGGTPRIFYYDDASKSSIGFGKGETGNIKKLETLNAEQSQLFKTAINEFLKQYNGTGGIHGDDTRNKNAPINEWHYAVFVLSDILKDDPEKFAAAVKEFYHNYAMACWEFSGDDFLSFSQTAMKQRGEAPENALYPSEKERETYVQLLENELFVKHQDMFLNVARTLEHQSLLSVNKMIREELVPLLNTEIVFTVKDLTLDSPTNFAASKYNAEPVLKENIELYEVPGEDGLTKTDRRFSYVHPMEFLIADEDGNYTQVGPPVFLPNYNVSGNVQDFGTIVTGLHLIPCYAGDFYPVQSNFEPSLIEGNTVFRCTYFNYLMMGAPTAMAFRDVSTDQKKAEIKDFLIPTAGSDGVIHVDIEVANTTDQGVKGFIGTWEGTEEVPNPITGEAFRERRKLIGEPTSEGGVKLTLYYKEEGEYKPFTGRRIGPGGEGYELNGTQLTFLDKDSVAGYELIFELHGDSINVIVPRGYYNSEIEDYEIYTMSYTLTRTSTTPEPDPTGQSK